MEKKFNKGDRVYHKNLKAYGTFEEYDWASNDGAFVEFDDEEFGCRCVTLNQLVKEVD